MKFLRALRIFGAVLIGIGLLGFGASFLAPSSMIVAFGVRALAGLKVISFGVSGIGALSLVSGTIPAVAMSVQNRNQNRLLENNREMERKRFDEYAHDSLNPAKTRIRFEQLRAHNPKLNGLINRCVGQMDRIDAYQARHRSLIEANEAIYLSDTIEVVDECERRMCLNFRNIINCCILVEDAGGVEDLDHATVEHSLKDNEEELNAVATLLRYSVAYINNYNRNGVSDRRELDAWLKIMKASMGENHEKNL